MYLRQNKWTSYEHILQDFKNDKMDLNYIWNYFSSRYKTILINSHKAWNDCGYGHPRFAQLDTITLEKLIWSPYHAKKVPIPKNKKVKVKNLQSYYHSKIKYQSNNSNNNSNTNDDDNDENNDADDKNDDVDEENDDADDENNDDDNDSNDEKEDANESNDSDSHESNNSDSDSDSNDSQDDDIDMVTNARKIKVESRSVSSSISLAFVWDSNLFDLIEFVCLHRYRNK